MGGRLPRLVPVTNLVLKTIEARRFQDKMEGPVQLRIDHNSHLSLVNAEADDRLRIDFQFTTSYGAFGVIKMEGTLILQTPEAKEAAEKWGKDRNLPPQVAQEVHQGILGSCVPDAVGLAKQIRLPPPIPLPQVRVGDGPDAKAKGAPTDSPEIG